jgi:hypothetical protein
MAPWFHRRRIAYEHIREYALGEFVFLASTEIFMRMIRTSIMVLTLVSSGAFGQTEWFTPMKGSATPEFQMSNAPGDRCLIFGTHIVKTTATINGGENFQIWHREGKVQGIDACELRSKPYASIEDFDNNEFYGLSAVYFFIDTGTSAGSRTLVVYKTDSGAEVMKIEYYDNSNVPRIEAARYLYYDAPSDRKGPAYSCPQLAKWKRQGGSAGWIQSKKLDLDTKKATDIGPLRCVYYE